jgi:hypothetical protein
MNVVSVQKYLTSVFYACTLRCLDKDAAWFSQI